MFVISWLISSVFIEERNGFRWVEVDTYRSHSFHILSGWLTAGKFTRSVFTRAKMTKMAKNDQDGTPSPAYVVEIEPQRMDLYPAKKDNQLTLF